VVSLVEYQPFYKELDEEDEEGEKELLLNEALEEVEQGPMKGNACG